MEAITNGIWQQNYGAACVLTRKAEFSNFRTTRKLADTLGMCKYLSSGFLEQNQWKGTEILLETLP